MSKPTVLIVKVQNKHLIAVYREHDRKQIHCRLNYLLETLNQQQRACVSTFLMKRARVALSLT